METLLSREKRPRVDSLPSDQVSLLLHTLQLHRSLLEAAHQDAKRLAAGHARPCYLVDYQLLHRFIYDEAENPETLVEFWYLLEQQDVTLIIGHGTFVEVLHRVQRTTNIHLPLLTGIDSYEQFVQRFGVLAAAHDFHELLERMVRDNPRDVRALKRLAEVLQRRNIKYVWNIESEVGSTVLDQDSYWSALTVLKAIRPPVKSAYPNAADALNIADVAGLRQAGANHQYPEFPFLLTDTRPLLDERHWAADPQLARMSQGAALSRTAITAVYSHLLLPPGTPADAVVSKTVQLSYHAGLLDRDLRSSAGYRHKLSMGDDRWEDIAAEGRITPGLAKQLGLLSSFVGDPVIAKTQRMYDNSRLAMANWSTQHGDPPAAESPRRLFDVILNLSRVLGEPDRPLRDLASFWHAVVTRRVEDSGDWKTLRYGQADERAAGVSYLEAERHRDFTIIRWSGAAELESILAAFGAAFGRHDVKTVDLLLGMAADVIQFDAELPVTSDELRDGIREAEEEFAPGGLGQRLWIRMNSAAFDLYADLLPAEPGADPVVGICARTPDLRLVRELYQATARRFLFDSWLDAVLADATRDEWRP